MGMAKYDRLLYILNLLRSRRNLNAELLAHECGVTERSIYRDIVALSEANIPIYYDNGYKLASDNFLPPLNFDYDEYLCLNMVLNSSPLQQTEKYRKVLKQLRAKLDASAPEPVRKKSKFTPQPAHLQFDTSIESDRCEQFYDVIERAVSECLCLDISYTSISSGQTQRIVEPHFIVFRGRAFYFVAYCKTRKEMRTFRMSRVEDVELLDESFIRQEGVDAESYFEGSWQVFSGKPEEVTIKLTGAAARVVQSGRYHSEEIIEQIDDDSVLYRVTVRGTQEILRWILGFGSDAEVIQPEELRQQLASIGHYLSETYES